MSREYIRCPYMLSDNIYCKCIKHGISIRYAVSNQLYKNICYMQKLSRNLFTLFLEQLLVVSQLTFGCPKFLSQYGACFEKYLASS